MLIFGLVGTLVGVYAALFWLGSDVDPKQKNRKVHWTTLIMAAATIGMMLVATSSKGIPFHVAFGIGCLIATTKLLVTANVTATDILGAMLFGPLGFAFVWNWLWGEAAVVHLFFLFLVIVMAATSGIRSLARNPEKQGNMSAKITKAKIWLKEN